MKTNYQSAIDRIKNAKNALELQKIERHFNSLWNFGGIFTQAEFARLDDKIVNRFIELNK